MELNGATMEACCREGGGPLARVFAERFGQKDAVTDFILLFGALDIAVPLHGMVPNKETLAEQPAAAQRAALRKYEAANEVAHAQVSLFCRRPELFDRYFRACMWSGLVFGSDRSLMNLRVQTQWLATEFEENKTPQSPYYWVYARQSMFLIKATGRDRILKGVAPDDLYAVAQRWLASVRCDINYAVPHPERPGWIIEPRAALELSWATQCHTPALRPFKDWSDDIVEAPHPSVLHQLLAVGYITDNCYD